MLWGVAMTRAFASLALLALLYAGSMGQPLVVAAATPGGSPPNEMAVTTAPAPPGGQNVPIAITYMEDWPAEAKQAFEYAVGIWAARLNSPVTIVVYAYWYPMFYSAACECTTDWAVVNGTLYPAALANAISGNDRNGAAGEMMINCNSSRSSWYFGTDGNPDSYHVDFVTVALHELAHGLGLDSLMYVDSEGRGTWDPGSGYPSAYDRFLVNASGQALITTYASPSAELAAQLTSDNLFFGGTKAIAANGGAMPKLYAPSPWRPGSSISHLDANTYDGTPNALMTPTLDRGQAHHAPGAVVLGILQDLGWSVNAPPPLPPPGMDESLFLPLVLTRAGL